MPSDLLGAMIVAFLAGLFLRFGFGSTRPSRRRRGKTYKPPKPRRMRRVK